MTGWAGWWTRMPSTTPLQPKNEMLIFGLRSTSDDQSGWSMDSNAIHNPPPAKKWNAHFWIMFNFWWLAGQVNGLKTHPPPLSSQKMKCLFLDYVQLLMIVQAGQWTQNPSATLLQPKNWNAHFWIMFNFWRSAGLVNGLETHPPPLSSQKNEMLVFGLLSISGDQPGWSMDSNPIHHPSPTKEWNAHFWITFNFWWPVGLVNGLESHLPPLSKQKNDMLIFVLCSTSDNWPGWSMDSNPICNLSPTKNMKCLFLDYAQLLMIGWAGQRTWSPSATSFQPTKWNACFGITFNFCWSAGLVDGLRPHLSPLSNQKNEMHVFALCSTSDDQPGCPMDSNPICYPSPAKKWNAHLWVMFNFWWLAGLVIGLKHHPPALSSQKKWNAHFWITFNFWWSARLVKGLKPHLQPLSNQQNEMLILVLCSTSVDQPGWSMNSNPIVTPLQLKNEMLVFALCSTSDDQPGWSMDSNPICHLSPGIK